MYNTNEMLLKLKGFQYAMPIDLNMGYYQIRISENESNLCTWGKNCYKRLPMIFAYSPEIPNKK